MRIEELPEIEFNVNLEALISERIAMYEALILQETGESIVLEKNDRDRIMIKSSCLIEYQVMKSAEEKIKNNLLRYARGEYLDNLEPVDVKRFLEQSAKVKMRLIIESHGQERRIIAGKRVTPNGVIFFENKSEVILPANVTQVDAEFTCKSPGIIGNGFISGQITTLVDSVPEVVSLSNIEESWGGTEKEDDESYRLRKIEGNAGTSVAGPEDLYVALAKSYDVNISDVKARSEAPGTVTIIILLKNGALPTTEFMEGLRQYMSGKDKRPMNDLLEVKAPEVVSYDLTLTYYAPTDKEAIIELQIDTFIAYQKSVIGRDINPTTLSKFLTDVGAERVDITLPIFTTIGDLEVAVCNAKNITYGGDLNAT